MTPAPPTLSSSPSVMEILEVVSERTDIPVAQLLGPRRMRCLARPRQVAMWAAVQLCPDQTLPQIGRAFDRDHTTIIHGKRKIAELLEQHHPWTVKVCADVLAAFQDDPRQLRLSA